MPEMSHKNHKKVQNPDADIIPWSLALFLFSITSTHRLTAPYPAWKLRRLLFSKQSLYTFYYEKNRQYNQKQRQNSLCVRTPVGASR